MIISLNSKIKGGKDTVGSIIQYLTWKESFKEYDKKEGEDGYSTYSYEEYLYTHQDKHLRYDLGKFEIKKFADELKDTICRWINCTREELEDHEFKNTPLGEEWWYYGFDGGLKINYLSAAYEKGKEPLQYLVKPTPRLLMQLLGTEAGRNILHPNLWINILFSKYKPKCSKFDSKLEQSGNYKCSICENCDCLPNWIITDNRFLNEIQAVKKHKGITIRIERDLKLRHGYDTLEELKSKDPELYKVVTHSGETELDDYQEFDYIIYNNGSLEELIEKVREILIKENIL